jgi:GTP-binding protein
VLQHALALNHKVIVVINKIDKPDARLDEVVNEVLELLLDLDATDEQLDSPIVYCSAREGIASVFQDRHGDDLTPLFDTIMEYIPGPEVDAEGPTQLLVSSIDYNEYVGRIGVGRVERGTIKKNQEVAICDFHDPSVSRKSRITALYVFEDLNKVPVDEAGAGDIVCLSGIEDINIGNTVCAPTAIEPVDFVKISEPTVEMTFSVNNSPFAGKEGKFLTSRHIRERLYRELLRDVALRVKDGETSESFVVMGRGELHLSILIENMRREGYEFQVSTPRVLFKEIEGKKCEPYEHIILDVPDQYVGAVIEKLGKRKGEMTAMAPNNGRTRVEFNIPSRGLFGYRSEFMTDTHGEGIMNTIFDKYAPYSGEINRRANGSLIAFETGEAVTYGLFNAQERGTLYITPGTPVYAGMVVGCSSKAEDITVNVCKKKHVTNMRASGSDEALRLVSPKIMSLEESLESLNEDEMLEVTPKSLRIRKQVLDHSQRMRNIMKSR